MNYLRYLILFISCVILQGVYAQTSDLSEGCFPLTVQFTAPAGATTFFWNFDDGASSTNQNPTNTFITSGTFVVEFRETPTGPIIGTISIDVYPKPTPTFSSDVIVGCAPLAVNFTNTTPINPNIIVNNYSWVFGDGGSTTGATSTHTFMTGGSYFVSLELMTNLPSCDVSEIYNDYISLTDLPLTSFTTTPSPASSCLAPLTVGFNNTSSSTGSPLTYNWDFGDGSSSSAINPNSVTYTSDGTYPVVLTATDTNGCNTSSQIIVGIGEPVASFSFPDTVCIDLFTEVLNLSPAGNYNWNFGPNSLISFLPNSNPSVRYTTSGMHSITLTLGGICPDDTTFNFYVEDPSAAFTSTPNYTCFDSLTVNYFPLDSSFASYSWSFSNGNISSLQNPSTTYTLNDTSMYSDNPLFPLVSSLTITTNAGCTATFIKTDTIDEPDAFLMPDIVDGCVPLTVQFSDSSTSNETIVSWEWFFGDGTSISSTTGQNQTHTYMAPGEYNAYLIIVNSSGCTDTSYNTLIKVGDVLTPDFSADSLIVCPGDSILFTDLTIGPFSDSIDTWHYGGDGDRLFGCFQDANPTLSFNNTAGPQDVTLTVGFNGCFSSSKKVNFINVKGPIADIHYSCSCDQPLTVNFADSSLDATNILWNFGDGFTSTLSNPAHTYTTSGDYTVILQATNSISGCVDSYDTTVIFIRDLQANFISDSNICQSVNSLFDASMSQDVDETCNAGYMWSFSNPSSRPITLGEDSIFFPLPAKGLNEVTLVVTDINDCKDTATSIIDVFGISANFSTNFDPICLPISLAFTDSSASDTTLTDWNWDFGNGLSSTNQNPTETIVNPTIISSTGGQDTLIVSLTVTNQLGCIAEFSKKIVVYEISSNVTVLDNALCVGESFQLTASDFTSQGSNLSFDWNFGNGTSTLQNPMNTYTNSGAYNINLIYEELSTGCRDSLTIAMQVRDYPIADFTSDADSALVICPNSQISFFDNSTVFDTTTTFSWDFGNSSSSSFMNPSTAFTDNGNYTVQLVLEVPSPFGCADTISKDYTVRGPRGSFVTTPLETICRLDSITFNLIDTAQVDSFFWDFGDGFLGNGTPISHQYTFVPPSGETVAKLIMSNTDGSCSVTYDSIITIHEVIADFIRNGNDLDTAICGLSFPFTNSSQNDESWYWNYGDGQTSSLQNPPPHTYNLPGVYSITLGVQSNTFGCTDTIIKEITLHPTPPILTRGDTICEGETGFINVINPNSNWNYSWSSSPIAPISNDNTPSPSSTPITTTIYTATVVDSNNCTNFNTAAINVINPLQLNSFDTIVPIGDVFNLPIFIDTSSYYFVWTPEDGLSCVTCFPVQIQPLEDQVYNLIVTDIYGCFSTEIDFDIKVHPETFVKLPTTFTPNGDGVNDVIFIEGWGIKELLEFKIFNRWGEKVFESNDQEVGWDGYYNGTIQNIDVYAYKVQVVTFKDEVKVIEGYINLMK